MNDHIKSIKEMNALAAESARILFLFQLYDVDRSGTIEREEFGYVLEDLGVDVRNDADIDKMFRDIDVDSNKCIDFEEFKRWWNKEDRSEISEKYIENIDERKLAVRILSASLKKVFEDSRNQDREKDAISVVKSNRTFLEAIESQDVKYVESVLTDDSNLVDMSATRIEDRATALHIAASLSSSSRKTEKKLDDNATRILRLLLEYGVYINAVDASGRTALHVACDTTSVEAAKLLVNVGQADIRIRSFATGSTCLHTAALRGSIDIVSLILESSLRSDVDEIIDAVDFQGHTALRIAAVSGNDVVCKHLLEFGASVSVSDRDGDSPLHAVSRIGDVDATLMILSACTSKDMNARRTNDHHTPLLDAVLSGHREVVATLTEFSVHVDLVDSNGDSPLHHAVMLENLRIVQILLAAGACVDVKDVDGLTPLHLTMMRAQSREIARALLKHGADPNLRGGEHDKTALHFASTSRTSHTVACMLLCLSQKCDVNAQTTAGFTPLHLVVGQDVATIRPQDEDHNSTPWMCLLNHEGVDVNRRSMDGFTPLQSAIAMDNVEATAALIMHGARVDRQAVPRVDVKKTALLEHSESKSNAPDGLSWIARLQRCAAKEHNRQRLHGTSFGVSSPTIRSSPQLAQSNENILTAVDIQDAVIASVSTLRLLREGQRAYREQDRKESACLLEMMSSLRSASREIQQNLVHACEEKRRLRAYNETQRSQVTSARQRLFSVLRRTSSWTNMRKDIARFHFVDDRELFFEAIEDEESSFLMNAKGTSLDVSLLNAILLCKRAERNAFHAQYRIARHLFRLDLTETSRQDTTRLLLKADKSTSMIVSQVSFCCLLFFVVKGRQESTMQEGATRIQKVQRGFAARIRKRRLSVEIDWMKKTKHARTTFESTVERYKGNMLSAMMGKEKTQQSLVTCLKVCDEEEISCEKEMAQFEIKCTSVKHARHRVELLKAERLETKAKMKEIRETIETRGDEHGALLRVDENVMRTAEENVRKARDEEKRMIENVARARVNLKTSVSTIAVRKAKAALEHDLSKRRRVTARLQHFDVTAEHCRKVLDALEAHKSYNELQTDEYENRLRCLDDRIQSESSLLKTMHVDQMKLDKIILTRIKRWKRANEDARHAFADFVVDANQVLNEITMGASAGRRCVQMAELEFACAKEFLRHASSKENHLLAEEAMQSAYGHMEVANEMREKVCVLEGALERKAKRARAIMSMYEGNVQSNEKEAGLSESRLRSIRNLQKASLDKETADAIIAKQRFEHAGPGSWTAKRAHERARRSCEAAMSAVAQALRRKECVEKDLRRAQKEESWALSILSTLVAEERKMDDDEVSFAAQEAFFNEHGEEFVKRVMADHIHTFTPSSDTIERKDRTTTTRIRVTPHKTSTKLSTPGSKEDADDGHLHDDLREHGPSIAHVRSSPEHRTSYVEDVPRPVHNRSLIRASDEKMASSPKEPGTSNKTPSGISRKGGSILHAASPTQQSGIENASGENGGGSCCVIS